MLSSRASHAATSQFHDRWKTQPRFCLPVGSLALVIELLSSKSVEKPRCKIKSFSMDNTPFYINTFPLYPIFWREMYRQQNRHRHFYYFKLRSKDISHKTQQHRSCSIVFVLHHEMYYLSNSIHSPALPHGEETTSNVGP